MSPPNESARGRGGHGEQQQGTTNRADSTTSPTAAQPSGISRIPSDLRMCGLLLDREHADAVEDLLPIVHNRDGRTWLEAWKRTHHPFVLIAGELHRHFGATVGGVAGDWPQALILFKYANNRFSQLATKHGSFSSVWNLLATDDRVREVRALIALTQETSGSA